MSNVSIADWVSQAAREGLTGTDGQPADSGSGLVVPPWLQVITW